jgi:hypothetical protein
VSLETRLAYSVFFFSLDLSPIFNPLLLETYIQHLAHGRWIVLTVPSAFYTLLVSFALSIVLFLDVVVPTALALNAV